MEHDRLNSPSTSVIKLEVMGHHLHFSQDPNSQHLGTTVWDASVVLAKYLERNCRRGRFSPSKLKGKRVIELGAGMALLGCDVITTDQKEVLPLLSRNVERNISRIVQGDSNSDLFGSIKVAELDWGNEDHISAVDPPFDYIIGTDVVYAEHLLEPLLKTIFAVSGPKTTILLGHEIRSTAVHEQMLDMWKKHFDVKSIPKSKMDIKYQHPSIQLYVMSPKPSTVSGETVQQSIEAKIGKTPRNDSDETCREPHTDSLGADDVLEDTILEKLQQGELSDWETRRYGSMAARLLKDVKIS
uniref:Uncharacterized protein n=1 Tax=Kalanchoe fedtschenkoi TaxID=63787 RepID=A0A7N0RCI7_KALFE